MYIMHNRLSLKVKICYKLYNVMLLYNVLLCYSMLCYAVSHYVYYVMLFLVISCYAMIFYVIFSYFMCYII